MTNKPNGTLNFIPPELIASQINTLILNDSIPKHILEKAWDFWFGKHGGNQR